MLNLCANSLGKALPIGLGGFAEPSQFLMPLPIFVGGARD